MPHVVSDINSLWPIFQTRWQSREPKMKMEVGFFFLSFSFFYISSDKYKQKPQSIYNPLSSTLMSSSTHNQLCPPTHPIEIMSIQVNCCSRCKKKKKKISKLRKLLRKITAKTIPRKVDMLSHVLWCVQGGRGGLEIKYNCSAEQLQFWVLKRKKINN